MALWRQCTYLEVEGLAALGESYTDVRALAAIALHAQDEVTRRVENRLDLGPRGGVGSLSKQLTSVGVLEVSAKVRLSSPQA